MSTQLLFSDEPKSEQSDANYSPRLQDFPLRERPVGRIYDLGTPAVSQIELLAVLVGGSQQLRIGQQLIAKYKELSAILKAPLCELEQIPGLGRAAAARLKAAFELGKRFQQERPDERPQIRSPADAANLLMMEMSLLDQEHLRLLLLDTKNRVLEMPTVYIGNLNTSVIRVGELFRYALRVNCAGIIVVHNHPSGDPTPSPEDVQVTRQIVEAGKLLDVNVLDHLVIGSQKFVSLKERRLGFT